MFLCLFQAESDLNELKALMHSPGAIVVSGEPHKAVLSPVVLLPQQPCSRNPDRRATIKDATSN